MKLRKLLATTSVLSLVLVGLVFASPAQAVVLACGAVLDSSFANTTVTLTADIGPCATDNGILIEFADGITLDLNGHSIIGNGVGNTGTQNGIGIYLFGTNNVTIKNGTVTRWNGGIFIDGSFGGSGNTVTSMRVVDNIGPDSQCVFGEGIQILFATGTRVFNNQIVHNGPFAGIASYSAADTAITGNVVANNNILNTSGCVGRINPNGGPGVNVGDELPTTMQNIGIWVVNLFTNPNFSANTSVVRNQVSGNGFDGIQLSRFATRDTISGNNVLRNGFGQPSGNTFRDGSGIATFGNSDLVSGNRVASNGGDGIGVYRTTSTGGTVLGGQSNTILRNRATGNGSAPKTVAFDLTDTNLSPPCDANSWNLNVFGTRNQSCVK